MPRKRRTGPGDETLEELLDDVVYEGLMASEEEEPEPERMAFRRMFEQATEQQRAALGSVLYYVASRGVVAGLRLAQEQEKP